MITPRFTVSRFTTREDGLVEAVLRLSDETIELLHDVLPNGGYYMDATVVLPAPLVPLKAGDTISFAIEPIP